MVVEPAMSCNDLDCGSMTIVSSVCYESGVQVGDDFVFLLPRIFLVSLGPLRFHTF